MKNSDTEYFAYDDDVAIAYILNSLPAAAKAQVDENDIQYVLDLVVEYYNENNMMDGDDDAEIVVSENSMFEYIWKIMEKEKVSEMDEDALAAILEKEYEYGKSVGIYFDEE